jgi:predicted nuclease with RNAse H fold
MLSIGIDLAGSKLRNTGFCCMRDDMCVKTYILKSDEEILRSILNANPDIVSVDAPLSLPQGRPNLETKGPPHLRACDKELIRLGIRFLPLTLGPMRMLTARGIRLRDSLVAKHVKVIECYPGAAQDVLGIPRKTQDVTLLQDMLIDIGIRGDIEKRTLTHDELDAVTAALVGMMYLRGQYTALGDVNEGQIIIPSLTKRKPGK